MKKMIIILSTIFFAISAHAQTLQNVEFAADSGATVNGTVFAKMAKDSSSCEMKISMGTSTMPVTSSPRTLGKDEPLGKSLYAIKGVKTVTLGYTTVTVSMEKDAVWPDVSDDVLQAIADNLWSNPKKGRKAEGTAMH